MSRVTRAGRHTLGEDVGHGTGVGVDPGAGALFVIGTLLPINMGALAYVAAWLVGMYALDLDEKTILGRGQR